MLRYALVPLLLITGFWFDSRPATAASYFTSNRVTRIDRPGTACLGKAVRYWTRRDVRVYVGTFYPRRLVLPCRRERPVAIISARFETFKVNFDRVEGCSGYATLKFTDWGKHLRIDFATTGAVRGMYCFSVGRRGSLHLWPR